MTTIDELEERVAALEQGGSAVEVLQPNYLNVDPSTGAVGAVFPGGVKLIEGTSSAAGPTGSVQSVRPSGAVDQLNQPPMAIWNFMTASPTPADYVTVQASAESDAQQVSTEADVFITASYRLGGIAHFGQMRSVASQAASASGAIVNTSGAGPFWVLRDDGVSQWAQLVDTHAFYIDDNNGAIYNLGPVGIPGSSYGVMSFSTRRSGWTTAMPVVTPGNAVAGISVSGWTFSAPNTFNIYVTNTAGVTQNASLSIFVVGR